MTLEHTPLTRMPVRIAAVQSRRRAGIFASAIAAAVLCYTAAEAAPIKFEFETIGSVVLPWVRVGSRSTA